MPWRRPLSDELAGAVPASDYLDRVGAALQPWGFEPERTFSAVSICRDELTQSLISAVSKRWGEPFNLGGLGGIPSLGRTGWGACLSHVPQQTGRGHLLVFGFPHVGIDPEGHVGRSLRRHQDRPTPTCGALSALYDSFDAPTDATTPVLDDAEAVRLRMLVSDELDGAPDGLLELTHAAARAVEREMWAELDALAPWAEMDVAVFTGIQVHLPLGLPDHVLGLSAELRVGPDGDRRPLTL